jgi:predicted TIM-barrel fold metal-dependent hydrolase
MNKPTIPGPDPNTRTPKFKLPPLACDAHTHIFGPGDKYPYAPGRPYTPPDAPLGDFRALHKKLGIGRAVIVNASVHGTDNRVALDAIAVSDNTFRAVANIDDTITERGLRELHEGGFRGCRFNFVRHLGGVPDMRVFHRIVAMVAPLGWHIDLHFDAIDLPEYAELLAKLPVRYTIDHMGRVKASDGLDQLPFRTLLELMTRDEKCWVKVCGCERVSSGGPPFHDAVPLLNSASVYPSAGADSTARAALMPPAPGMFSMTKRWPSFSPRFSVTSRAVTSATPPAPNGRISRTGLFG